MIFTAATQSMSQHTISYYMLVRVHHCKCIITYMCIICIHNILTHTNHKLAAVVNTVNKSPDYGTCWWYSTLYEMLHCTHSVYNLH